MTDVHIDVEHGTPESAWDVAALASLPAFDPGPPTNVLVVAPHPDDDVLGIGGLLQRLRGDGHRIELVAVTDGEASHPESTTVTPDDLAGRRRIEAAQARQALGLAGCPSTNLGLPDGDVASHEATLAEALTDLVTEGSIVLATWRGDGHPDHEATGRAASVAARTTGARLVEYPVWAWHWAWPDDRRVPWGAARAVALRPPVLRAKRRAIRAFRTQLEPVGPGPGDGPVVTAAVLAHHLRPVEVVFG